MGLKLCWIYIQSGWYYIWMFETRLVQYFEQPFFRSYSLLLTPWISFSHLFISFTHAHRPLYFSKASRHRDLIIISSKFGTRQGDPLGGLLFTLAHLCILCPIATTHPTFVFPSLANDTHIVGLALDELLGFLQLQKEFKALGLLVK